MFGYNGYYGGVYQQPNSYPQSYPQAQPAGNSDDRIWVQGEIGAKAYLIAPGATVPLWDSEKQRIYLKSMSANGIPSMQCLNYSIQATNEPQTANVDNSITNRVDALEKALDGLKTQIKGVIDNAAKSNANDTAV